MKPYSTPIREYEQAVYVYWLGPSLPTVKIGHTNNPARRLEEFRRETGTPGHKSSLAAIVWLDRRREAVELAVHRRLAAQRRNGEWFSVSPGEALAAIVAIAENMNIRYEVEDRADITGAIARRESAAAEVAEAERQQVEVKRAEIRFRWGVVGDLCGIIEVVSERGELFTDVGLCNYLVTLYPEAEAWSKASRLASEYRSAYAYQFQGPTIPQNPVRKAGKEEYIRLHLDDVLTQPLCDIACALVAYATEYERRTHERATAKAEHESLLARYRTAAVKKEKKDRFFRNFQLSLWALIIATIGGGMLYIESDTYKAEARAEHAARVQACEGAGGRWGNTGRTSGKYRNPVMGCI